VLLVLNKSTMEQLRRIYGLTGMSAHAGDTEHARADAHTPNGNLDILARASLTRENLPTAGQANGGIDEDNQEGYGGYSDPEECYVTPERCHNPHSNQEHPSVHFEDEQPPQLPLESHQRGGLAWAVTKVLQAEGVGMEATAYHKSEFAWQQGGSNSTTANKFADEAMLHSAQNISRTRLHLK
jgi:hypothetical protein